MAVVDVRATTAVLDKDRVILRSEEHGDLRALYLACSSWLALQDSRKVALSVPGDFLCALRELGSIRDLALCAPEEDRRVREHAEWELLHALLRACSSWEDRQVSHGGPWPFREPRTGVAVQVRDATARAREWLRG